MRKLRVFLSRYVYLHVCIYCIAWVGHLPLPHPSRAQEVQPMPLPLSPPSAVSNLEIIPGPLTRANKSEHDTITQRIALPQQNAPTQQTGTSNFLALEDAGNIPPLTPRQKFKVVARGIFDPFEFVLVGFVAGLCQAITAIHPTGKAHKAMQSATALPTRIMPSKISCPAPSFPPPFMPSLI
jgi:hypothetical protein